ncbi:CheB methylesterase domain-containing protein [Selenomonas sp. KH1T6]|uniref:CheB methylesterase domain-containing protein n=1 Tax=Selenomonas sp. KH1T6 TaxID=3158784 RepID=UPI0008A80277|nr:two-component system, chemotaxis family, response regulator CheB [Selenomonas ruminantium]
MPALRVLVIGNQILGDNKIAQELALRLPKDSQVEFSSGAAEAIEKTRQFKPNAVVLNFSMALTRIEGEMLISLLAKKMQIPTIAFGRVNSSQQTAQRMGALKYMVKSSDPLLSDHFYHLLADDLQALRNAPASARPGEGAAAPRPVSSFNRPAARPGLSPLARRTPSAAVPPAAPPSMPPPRRGGPIELIAIGSSTGGTEALSVVLHGLKPPLPGIVIVQHIPAMFSKLLANRLNEECPLSIKEAETGDKVEPNHVYIAPGGKHMTLSRTGSGPLVLDCTPGPPVHSCCPAVDVLFDTVAKYVGDKALGVILTGMGRDGADGLSQMRAQGAYTLGQDEATSVVYGMPKAAFDQGAVCEQLPLPDIAAAITRVANNK